MKVFSNVPVTWERLDKVIAFKNIQKQYNKMSLINAHAFDSNISLKTFFVVSYSRKQEIIIIYSSG